MISILSKAATWFREQPFGEAFSCVFSSPPCSAQLIWTAVMWECGVATDPREETTRIVVFQCDSDDAPDPFKDRLLVKMTKESIGDFVERLHVDEGFFLGEEAFAPKTNRDTLNKRKKEFYKDLLATIPTGNGQKVEVEYTNRWIRVTLPEGVASLPKYAEFLKLEESQKEEKLADVKQELSNFIEKQATLYSSSDYLFDLPAGANRFAQLRPASRLESDPGFNVRWIEQLIDAIIEKKTGTRRVKQLTGRFLSYRGELYRPEIETFNCYTNGRLEVLVTFSAQIQDSWLQSDKPVVALAANMALATRIRHELLETYLNKLPRWRKPETINAGFSELARILVDIEPLLSKLAERSREGC